MTPFVPFGPQPNPNIQPNGAQSRLNEALSQGLGRRLLNLAGIEPNSTGTGNQQALQNSTVLQQLNRGVHSIYDGLSKAYNSTIQQQIQLLQERFRSQNNTNPWQQRMAEQVPQFFKTMADRVGSAQTRLSEAWDKFKNANATDLKNTPQTRSTLFGSFDSLINNNFNSNSQNINNNDFFANIGRSINSAGDLPTIGPNGEIQPPRQDMVGQLKNFWNAQVKPQIDTVRNMMARTWRDMTTSGVYNPVEGMITSRSDRNLLNSAPPSDSANELVDSILSSADLEGPEYTLVDAKQNDSMDPIRERANTVGSQMQTRLITMQRELNHLWTGLTNSLQKAIANARDSMARTPSQPLMMAASENRESLPTDPAANEISSKLQDIARVQSDADRVYDAVQRQQMQQQQRNSLSERMKNFYNNFDDSLSKWGSSFNDFWNKIPERWNTFVNNRKPGNNSTTSTSTTTPKPSE